MDFFPKPQRTAVRLARALALLVVIVIEVACGDVFRPIAIPANPHPPDPESLHFALMIADNGPDACSPPSATCDDNPHPSSSSRIDVSGDTNVGSATVGLGPVHATLIPPNGSQAFVVNSLEDTVSSYSTSTPSTVNTISLPNGSTPVFAHTTESANVYIANSGNATVSVISASRNVVRRTIPVGNNPVALAETPDGKKLYVVNQGDGTVTVVNTVDDSITSPPVAVAASPNWAAARSDNAFVYVLSPGNQIAVINTLTDTVSTTVAVPNANFAFYDKTLNRIYLTTTDRKLLVLNVASADPAPVAGVDLSVDPTGGANPPCPAGCVLDSVTALPDGSRAYIASHQITPTTCSHVDPVPDDMPPCIVTRVNVIKTPVNALLTTITTQHKIIVDPQTIRFKPDVPLIPFCNQLPVRRYIAAAADSSKVYVANCDAGGADIVRTSDDSFVLDLQAPVSSLPALPGQDFPPPQRPRFIVPGR
jgi:YVTN family beta-propeller protein